MNISGHSFGSSHMPPIAEEENKSIDVVSSSRHHLQKAISGNQLHTDDFLNSSWDNSAMRDIKRGRDNNGHAFSTSIVLETQVQLSEFSYLPSFFCLIMCFGLDNSLFCRMRILEITFVDWLII